MPRAERELLERACQAFNRWELDELVELYHPDCIWEMSKFAGPHDNGVYRGHEGLRRICEEWHRVWEHVQLESTDMWRVGERSLVTCRLACRDLALPRRRSRNRRSDNATPAEHSQRDDARPPIGSTTGTRRSRSPECSEGRSRMSVRGPWCCWDTPPSELRVGVGRQVDHDRVPLGLGEPHRSAMHPATPMGKPALALERVVTR